jgi:predicted metal-dependent peptidase
VKFSLIFTFISYITFFQTTIKRIILHTHLAHIQPKKEKEKKKRLVNIATSIVQEEK